MKLNSTSTTAKFRRLAARRLGPDAYLRQLATMADLEEGAGNSLISVERTFELRHRIRLLEQKIRELEAQK